MLGRSEPKPGDNRRQYYGFLVPIGNEFFFDYCKRKSVCLTWPDGRKLDPFWMGWKEFEKVVGCLILPQPVTSGESDIEGPGKLPEDDGYCLAIAAYPQMNYLKESKPTEEQINAIIKELNDCGVEVAQSDPLWYRGGITDIMWMPAAAIPED
ncbi:hypothetical protein SCP_0903180 [Sparassis crispa]|uniref:Uncharacterized protein n=1 Tax=Sparassis crispa TaxID=139825 RepID=A0A401GW99_9APHY|nr:hypothetical protein SCP_0903180 [Sparassis crispa]GBE86439.1 hypothetical protein SCP_0903180 [Sparassis crispa]